MNRIAILLTAMVVFGIAVANVILGQRLILPLPVATERGAGVPWYISWGMVWVSVGCAVVLGLFLITSTLRAGRR
jgi:uncharacterized membrane protein